MVNLGRVRWLAFDVFGTVMDLTGSLSGPVGDFLRAQGSVMSGGAFYADWRDRQRVEQYQDNLLMLGHSGYLETCRRAFIYCLREARRQLCRGIGPGVYERVPGLAAF